MKTKSTKKEKINFYYVKVNGEDISNVETVTPPTGGNSYWIILRENEDTIWASGNVTVKHRMVTEE